MKEVEKSTNQEKDHTLGLKRDLIKIEERRLVDPGKDTKSRKVRKVRKVKGTLAVVILLTLIQTL